MSVPAATTSVTALELRVEDVGAARAFYEQALSLPSGIGQAKTSTAQAETAQSDAAAASVRLDLHGLGQLVLTRAATARGHRGDAPGPVLVVSYVLEQPSEVTAVVDAAQAAGAAVLKPAKKALFGSFAGSFQAPDGTLWKVACDKRRDAATPGVPPVPGEIGVLLGVADPKTSRAFYAQLGMEVDRDYGNKYIDFAPHGSIRLGLMPRQSLAKDVGAGNEHRAAAAAVELSAADGEVPEDGPSTDPDGFTVTVTADH